MRVNPPRLDPGSRVLGEDAPPWIAAVAAVMGLLLAAAGLWAWQGRSADADAAPAPRLSGVSRSIPTSTALLESRVSATTRPEPTPTTVASTVSTTGPSSASTVVANPPLSVATAAAPCPAPIAIWFPSGSSVPQLDPSALAPVVDWLLEDLTASVVVRGHASAVGDDRTNLLLSYERARYVSGTLAALGVPAGKMVVRAAGALEPVAENPNDPLNQQVLVEPAPATCGAT